MKNPILMLIILLMATSYCCCQPSPKDRALAQNCESCAAVFEYGNKTLNSTDTLPDFTENGSKLLIKGVVYNADGKTPAENVIVYIYHTNDEGLYPTRSNSKGFERQHGYIRGWAKTNKKGEYAFYTRRPGAYPGRNNPEHVHIIIREKGISPYYVDDILFDDDPILTSAHRSQQQQRGGNGIVKIDYKDPQLAVVLRDIILGKNIPGY